jgi:hypothetical protein
MKAISARIGGKTIGLTGDVDVVAREIKVAITKTGVKVSIRVPMWLVFSEWQHGEFKFEESRLVRIEEGRNAGKAAGGAIAGALLLGPLGMLAGAALGGAKKRVMVLQSSRGGVLVFEATSEDMQQLASHGLVTPP